jgi:general secretion pathway protein C
VLEVQPRFVMLSEGGVKKRVDLAPHATAGTDSAPPAAPTAQPGDLAPRPGGMVPSVPAGGGPLPQGALTPPPPPQMPAPVRTAGQPSEPPTEPPAEPTTEAPTQ